MIAGKKIQNFITFQTKETIYMKQNQPQLIVHQQTIETDSLKQLLSTKRSKHRPNFFQSQQNSKEKQNHELNNDQKKVSNHKKSHFTSSQSKSKNNSKEKSYSGKDIKRIDNYLIQQNQDKVKEFDLKEHMKRSKSSRNKLTKKVKSLIRLPRFDKNGGFELDRSKGRKSYSPSRNFSENMRKVNLNNCSTQCIKTTKFTESKDPSKHLKSTKIQKNAKKQSTQPQTSKKQTKSKQKHKVTLKSKDHKNYQTQRRRQEDMFNRVEIDKNKKAVKKVSPSKKGQTTRRKAEQFKKSEEPKENRFIKEKQFMKEKQKPITKKRKSMTKSKKNLHFQSTDEMLMMRNQKLQSTKNDQGLTNYLSNRDSFKKKVKTDRDSFKPKTDRDSFTFKPKRKQENASGERITEKQIVVSSKNLNKVRNQAATKIQKVYKGYIIRKWLGEYLRLISATVVIQKHWRGCLARKRVQQLMQHKRRQQEKLRIQNEAMSKLKEENSSRYNSIKNVTGEDSKLNIDQWKDILAEVMQQKTVNPTLKQKIKLFLENENESARSSIVSRSRNSEQKLREEVDSERRYFEKQHKKELMSHSGKKSKKYHSPESFSITQEQDFSQLSHSSLKYSRQPNHYKSPKVSSPDHVKYPLHDGEGRLSHGTSNQAQSLGYRQRKMALQAPISPKLNPCHRSPQHMIQDLQEIQNYQKQCIRMEAKYQKQQLQQKLRSHIFSPRSYQEKQKQIDQRMEESLKRFQSNIQGVIQSCQKTSDIIANAESNCLSQSLMMTPEHSCVKEGAQNLSQNQLMSRLFEKTENDTSKEMTILDKVQLKSSQQPQQRKSPSEKPQKVQSDSYLLGSPGVPQQMMGSPTMPQEMMTYENFETFNVNALSQQRASNNKNLPPMTKIDQSYSFVDEYLLTLIEYLRNKNQGQVMRQIIKSILTSKTLQPLTVLKNLEIVKEENGAEDDGFALPMYKYLEDDLEIIRGQDVDDYNKYFKMIKEVDGFSLQQRQKPQSTSVQSNSEAVQHYLKLLVDSFNEALNLKRPSKYLSSSKSLQTHNFLNLTNRPYIDHETEYDLYCASSMQQIFTWFNVKYGLELKDFEEEDAVEMNSEINRHNNAQLLLMMKMQAEKQWDEYYETLEIIAKLGEEVWEELIVKETLTILNIEKRFMREREFLR